MQTVTPFFPSCSKVARYVYCYKWFFYANNLSKKLEANHIHVMDSEPVKLLSETYCIFNCILLESAKLNKIVNKLWGTFPDGWKDHITSLSETTGVCKGLRKNAISTRCNTCLRSTVYCLSLPCGEIGWQWFLSKKSLKMLGVNLQKFSSNLPTVVTWLCYQKLHVFSSYK